MRIYLIRHGQTAENKKQVHQPDDSVLSKIGGKQSEAVASLLKNHGIEKIISSDIARAVQTADIISATLGLPVEKSDLWREVRRPSSLGGRSHYSIKTFDYVLRTIFNRNKSSWHYEDAESLLEVHERTRKAERYFKEMHTSHKAVAVITHAIFLEIFVTFMCKRGRTGIFDYFPIFSPFSTVKNGSLSVMEHYDTEAENVCAWRLELFNDVSHLKR